MGLNLQKTEIQCPCHITGLLLFSNTVIYCDIIMQFLAFIDISKWDYILQQDSATTHTAGETIEFLQKFFGDGLVT